jgi:hypothetical protein
MQIKLIAPREQSKDNMSSAETFKTMLMLPPTLLILRGPCLGR